MKYSLLFFCTSFIFINSIFSQNFELVGPFSSMSSAYILKSNPNHIFIENNFGALISVYNDGTKKELLHPGFGYGRQVKVLESDTNVIFLNTATLLIRTSDYGKNWSSIGDGFIAVNEIDDRIVYWYNPNSNELKKSYNFGQDWIIVHTFQENIQTFAVSPSDSSILYAGSLGKLYKSYDAGNNWENVLVWSNHFNPYNLSINRLNPNTLYVFNDVIGYGLSMSKDGGKNFNTFGPYLTSYYSQNPIDTMEFYFASNALHYWPYGLFVKSIDEGQTWIPYNNNFLPTVYLSIPVFNPQNGEEIYISSEQGIFKSLNGGKDWVSINLASNPILDFYIDPNGSDKIVTVPGSGLGFWMTTNSGTSWFIPEIDTLISPRYGNTYYQIVFSPNNPNNGYIASDTALLRTTDGGFNWVTTFPYYNWLKSIAYSPVNPNILLTCGIDDPNGGAKLYKSTDGGFNWSLINNLNAWYNGIKKIIFHPTDINIVYGITRDSLIKSTNQGVTWKNINNGLISSQGYVMLFQSQFWLNPNNTEELYVTQRATGIEQSGGLSMSTNGGESWFQIDSSLKALDSWCSATGLWVDPENTNRIYVGLMSHSQGASYTNGGIYFTDNQGQNWMKIFDSYADIIKADNSNPRNVYFNTGYGLLRIKDTLVTEVNESILIVPIEYGLSQNYPNPFNQSTKISYSIVEQELVNLEVYDILGQKVVQLVNEVQEAGNHSVLFDASKLTSGIYLYRLQSGSYTSTKKMILTK